MSKVSSHEGVRLSSQYTSSDVLTTKRRGVLKLYYEG